MREDWRVALIFIHRPVAEPTTVDVGNIVTLFRSTYTVTSDC